MVAMVLVILPQVLVPTRDRVGPPVVIPLIEVAAFVIMLVIAAKPGPVPRHFQPTILVLFGVLITANTIAAGRLALLVLDGGKVDGVALSAGRLLAAGSLVLFANVITFGLLYWQFDRGGPSGRVADPVPYADFLFPQAEAAQSRPGWRPTFPDYLYVAFTTVVAFSPTDTLPLSVRAKALMALQSLISLAVIVVVLARVINILPA